MALVIKDKPLTLARLRASVVYRVGAVPRGGDTPSMRSELDRKNEDLEMLRLELDVNRSDAQLREDRLAAVERRLAAHETLIDEYLGAAQTMCVYLADAISRLRASS